MGDYLMISLVLVNFFANSAYSSIAPFYPKEALAKGVPEELIGFVFAGYSVSMLIMSPIAGKVMAKLGRKKVLMNGLFCEACALGCFGFLKYVNDPTAFAILTFAIRSVEGTGNACLNVSSAAIIAGTYPDKIIKLNGILQAFTGLGMVSGPL
jgi:MFS family permease